MQNIHCPFQQQNHESQKCLQKILHSICVLKLCQGICITSQIYNLTKKASNVEKVKYGEAFH